MPVIKAEVIVDDPVGMNWLEIQSLEKDIPANILNSPEVLRSLNTLCYKKCDHYYECLGVQGLDQPYNRLERKNEFGNMELIKPKDCLLYGSKLILSYYEKR